VLLESTICPTTYRICLKRRLCQDTRRDAILRLLASRDCRVLLTEVFIVTFIVQSPLSLNDLNHKIDDLRIWQPQYKGDDRLSIPCAVTTYRKFARL